MATVTRIDEFLADIEGLTLIGNASDYSKDQIKNARDSINKRCKKEIDYLRKHLALTSLRRARSDYRNAIKARFKGQHLAMTCKDRNGFATHIAYKYLVLNKTEVKSYSDHEKDRINSFLDGDYRIFIRNAKQMINHAIGLLDSDSFYDIATGLLLLTGRRSVEVLKTASFEAIAANKVLFSGQAKKSIYDAEGNKLDAEAYEIYTLCDAEIVAKALHKLRSIKDYSNKTEREVNSLAASALNKAVKRNFLGKYTFNLDGVACMNIEAKSLRSIYVHLAQRLFKENSELTKFANSQLGHSDRKTADNYMEYKLHPDERL